MEPGPALRQILIKSRHEAGRTVKTDCPDCLTDGVAKALIADLAPADLRATVLGLHSTIVGIGLLPASLLAGLLWSALGPVYAFGLGALTGAAAAVGMALLPGRPAA